VIGRLTRFVYGHIIMTMKKRTIPAGRFKAECLALLDRVADTGESVVVTKRGRPVAEVVPLRTRAPRTLRGSVTVRGDMVAPVLGDWNLER
jgi:prevent-host-death family protein